MKLIILLAFFISFDQSITAKDTTTCGDWEQFKTEYCFKVPDRSSIQSFENAEKTCHQLDATLITIRYQEEQDFLVNYLFKTNKIVDNVWLGGKYTGSSGKFKWEDKSQLTYTNWIPKSPKNLTNYCIEMRSDVDTPGKWVDEPCEKKNLVVCQKKQSWSLSKLQEVILEIKRNLVPVGFTYVQLPKDKSPAVIWPEMTWTDVSADYAGVFFRVEGGDAAKFGEKQAENTPRLTGVKYSGNANVGKDEIKTKLGDWSDWCHSASYYSSRSEYRANSYQMSAGEVRPVNMAIRVWKRTG